MKFTSLSLFFILFTVSICCSQTTNNGRPTPGEPGKCYAKCLITSTFDTITSSYAVYVGSTPEQVVLTSMKHMVSKAKHDWIQQVDPDCTHKKRKKCLVWRWVEVKPAVFEELQVVVNPEQASADEIEYREYETIIKTEDSYTDWREVICHNRLTPRLIKEIRQRLFAVGYENNTASKQMDTELKEVLIQFQQKMGLPCGQVDMETLKHLGIKL